MEGESRSRRNGGNGVLVAARALSRGQPYTVLDTSAVSASSSHLVVSTTWLQLVFLYVLALPSQPLSVVLTGFNDFRLPPDDTSMIHFRSLSVVDSCGVELESHYVSDVETCITAHAPSRGTAAY